MISTKIAQLATPGFQRIRRGSDARHGFTLVEVLVATAVTLLMMVSLARVFKIIGDSMQEGRATLELNNRLRNVALRIQRDLGSVTVTPGSEGEGYFEYFDGAQTDYTAGLARTFDAEGNLVNHNRYGDADDIIMMTARADDVWFTGKVPLFVLLGRAPVAREDFEMVTIASQYAEIALFAQPVVSNQIGTGTAAVPNPGRDPAYLVQDPWAFQTTGGLPYDPTSSTNVNRLPETYRLHYRTLLIRPDLNVNGVLPSGTHPDGGDSWLLAGPDSAVIPGATTAASLPSPLCDTARAFAQSDLSMRRVYNQSDGLPAGVDNMAANDLQSLSNPANRFAHVQVPIPGAAATTMPLLALGPQLQLDFDDDRNDDIQDPSGFLGGNTFEVGSGFLHPAFTLHTAWDAAGIGSGLPDHQSTASRVGEDILAADILGFDIKAFDPGVPLLVSFGADLLPGIANTDDDGVNGIDDDGEIGWDGTDDQLLSPSDPGYGPAMAGFTQTPRTSALVATGEYVDLGWARKTILTLSASGIAVPGGFNTIPNFWSELSGYDQRAWPTIGGPFFTDDMFRSGKALQNFSSGEFLALQFTADSSDYRHYDSDGLLQAQIAGLLGTTNITGAATLFTYTASPPAPRLNDGWRAGIIDAASDGIDNNGIGGIDDITERETASPFGSNLRGLKVTIRMEDPATRIIKQMSIGKEFVTAQ
ncbi:MAG: type II secretion system protein J [Aureliella sp.]